MRTTTKISGSIILLIFISSIGLNSLAQEIPLVYSVENTGADCPAPPLPPKSELPVVEPLTDPFMWSDGSGRVTDFNDWSCRRAEIKAEFEHYEIGLKPDRPDTINASYADGLLTVEIIENGDTLILTSSISLPEGEGPFPAVIGMGGGSGSLPADIFSSRNIARIPFNFGQVMAHSQARGSEPINKLYPDLVYMGAYSAWPWGVSRLIDGLELVAEDLPIDLSHLAVTGCSFAGKMALFAGAFDERIALTIAQESGGGGAAAWRVSETLGNVETLGATSRVWFIEDMFQFSGSGTANLPMDHHELMAMVAPRALLVLGNPDYTWLAEESGYVSSRAAHRVWEEFGISDRMGFSIVDGHGHCALPEVQRPEVEAFVEKFLLDSVNADTEVAVHSYSTVDYGRWTEWWGSGDPVFPDRTAGDNEFIFYEAECAEPGANWDVGKTNYASGAKYVKARDDLESLSEAPLSADDQITINFNIETAKSYNLFLRVSCTNENSDSFWLKLDDGNFVAHDTLNSSGWEWKFIDTYELSSGEHTLTIAYRENGAFLDKIMFTDFPYVIDGMGADALNACVVGIDESEAISEYTLSQNFPNPAAGHTRIFFEIPESAYVSLKVYSVLGEEMAELAGKEFATGKYSFDYDTGQLAKGVYFYTINVNEFSASRKLIVQKD